MNCDVVRQRLSAWHDGELSSAEREDVDAHLAACPACRAAADELIALDVRLRRTFQPNHAAAQAVATTVLTQMAAPVILRRPSLWRTGGIALTAAAAGFLFAWFLFATPRVPPQFGTTPEIVRASTPEPTIRLTVATGAVEVEQAGQWKPMATGGLLACGQRVRTPQGSRCEFRTPDGSEIRLNHDSEVVFETERKVNLRRGQVWSTVTPAPDQFQLLAATLTVTAMGTQFDVQQRGERMLLHVLEGKTRVDGGGQSRLIEAGQQLELNGRQLGTPFACPEEQLLQATGWVNELLALKGRGNPELVRRVNELLVSIGRTKVETLPEEEIRSLGDHCVVPLTRYLQAPQSQDHRLLRHKAARLIAELAQPVSIGDMIQLLTDADPVVRSTVAAGLQRLTGKELAHSVQEWQQANPAACQAGQKTWQTWWTQNQGRFPSVPR